MNRMEVCGLTSTMATTSISFTKHESTVIHNCLDWSLGEFTPVCCIVGSWVEYLNSLLKLVLHFGWFLPLLPKYSTLWVSARHHLVIGPNDPNGSYVIHPFILPKRHLRRKHTWKSLINNKSRKIFFKIKSYLKRWMWPKFYTIENKVKQTACV